VVVFPFAFHIAVQQPFKPLWSRLLLYELEPETIVSKENYYLNLVYIRIFPLMADQFFFRSLEYLASFDIEFEFNIPDFGLDKRPSHLVLICSKK
jgi:hypothetical protein